MSIRGLLLVVLLLGGYAAAADDRDSLNILIYGATGKIGSLAVDEALNRGHRVTAVSRDPSQIEKHHDKLVVAKGDLLDAASIADLASGQDVIIVSVRGIIGKSGTPESALQRIAVEKVVDVLRLMGGDAPRLIHVGGSGSLEVRPGVYYGERIPKIFLPKKLELEIRGQILALEYLRAVNDVRWTYATPPKNLTNGKRTGQFRIGGDALVEGGKKKRRVSRADFAVALIDEAESASHTGQRFSVAY